MRRRGWLLLAVIAVLALVGYLNKKEGKTVGPNPLDCPTIATSANVKNVGTVSFKAGATQVRGSGSITVSPTGKPSHWQVKGDEGIDLAVYLLEDRVPREDPELPAKAELTNFYNNGSKPVTLIDDAEDCALTLQPKGRKTYPGDGTVKVVAIL